MWDVADIHEDINPSSGLIQDVVLKQRSAILDALCTCGSSEHLEQVINVMLAQEQLTWEDYQNVQVSGRALYTNARQLLDLVYTKGAETCEFFLSALQQVLPDLHGLELSPQAICGPQEYKRDWQSTSSHSLLSQRPRLVEKLQGCISGALEVLTQSGHFSSLDCDQVLLSIHTPSQQVITRESSVSLFIASYEGTDRYFTLSTLPLTKIVLLLSLFRVYIHLQFYEDTKMFKTPYHQIAYQDNVCTMNMTKINNRIEYPLLSLYQVQQALHPNLLSRITFTDYHCDLFVY